jgi:hypothetical protein
VRRDTTPCEISPVVDSLACQPRPPGEGGPDCLAYRFGRRECAASSHQVSSLRRASTLLTDLACWPRPCSLRPLFQRAYLGPPRTTPRALAAARAALVREAIMARSFSASAANRWDERGQCLPDRQTVSPKLGNDKRYPAAPSSRWDALNAPKAPIGAIGACGLPCQSVTDQTCRLKRCLWRR